jgi:hypothetical protein
VTKNLLFGVDAGEIIRFTATDGERVAIDRGSIVAVGCYKVRQFDRPYIWKLVTRNFYYVYTETFHFVTLDKQFERFLEESPSD